MTKFEEITKDTETLAKFLMIQVPSCDDCIAQEECKKLLEAGVKYKGCTRAWCAWLNKEV